MRVPLPRVWDAVEGGLAEPTRATISHGHQHTVGGDVSIAGLEESRRWVGALLLWCHTRDFETQCRVVAHQSL
jgi:hypothetical protein